MGNPHKLPRPFQLWPAHISCSSLGSGCDPFVHTHLAGFGQWNLIITREARKASRQINWHKLCERSGPAYPSPPSAVLPHPGKGASRLSKHLPRCWWLCRSLPGPLPYSHNWIIGALKSSDECSTCALAALRSAPLILPRPNKTERVSQLKCSKRAKGIFPHPATLTCFCFLTFSTAHCGNFWCIMWLNMLIF